jgi:hypothetical protein
VGDLFEDTENWHDCEPPNEEDEANEKSSLKNNKVGDIFEKGHKVADPYEKSYDKKDFNSESGPIKDDE